MAKHEQQPERMEREADRLEEQGDRIERRIDDARKDWESKEHDSSVPGAQPKPFDGQPGRRRRRGS